MSVPIRTKTRVLVHPSSETVMHATETSHMAVESDSKHVDDATASSSTL